ncbi:MAG: HlyD family efflux transporter periplasmic adaptor subunit [Pirellulales bacterium]|nr:HlyD family efflux transporter periplasmic adaptor subunit [Pirellulales bacterium]
MATSVDLRQLAVDRGDARAGLPARRRPWVSRYGIPFVIVLGFAIVVTWSFSEQFLPAKSVTVTPVLVSRAEIQQSGTPLFQAAGWVEPRPTAVMASAMVEGIVDKLLVVEGQAVEKDQPLAKLVDQDSRLALAEAQALLQLREAELAEVEAAQKAAASKFEQPLQLQAAYAEAEAALAKLQTEMMNLPFAIRSAKSRQALAQQDYDGKSSLTDSIAGRVIQRAKNELDTSTALVEELENRAPSLEKEAQAWQRKCEALKLQLEAKTDETRKLGETQAQVKAAQARLQQAKLAVDSAGLRLQRMTVVSPIAGRVLSLNAQPGRRLMGINAASERDASTVASLYDPARLQVRADVRLEDVSRIQSGQPVQISSAALKTALAGEVITATSFADIQKNTLQVKVAIHDPPDVIKPEMLVQVTFLAPPQTSAALELAQETVRLLIPTALVEKSESGAQVWIADRAKNVARKQSVRLGTASTQELTEVVEGLTPLDKLVVGGREGLTEGERIKISGDDTSLGSHNSAVPSKPTNKSK